jgi:hypothetical protein
VSPELEDIRRAVERLTCGCSEAAWRYAPAGKWTSGQILEHLLLSYTGTTKGLLKAMDAGRPLGSKPSWPDRGRTFLVTRFGILRGRRTSPRHTTPTEGLELGSLRRFYDALVAMDATLSDAERRFGASVKLLDHPFLGPMNAKEWRQFHRAHARHHLRQMAELMRNENSRSTGGNPSQAT